MPLSKAQLRQIEKVIRERMLRFTYETLGEAPLTEEEIKILKDAGLLRKNVRNLIADSYTVGKVVALMDRKEAKDLGFGDIMEMARDRKVLPTTAVEKQAMDWASVHAGQYIKGLTDDMIRDATTEAARGVTSAIRAVQNEVKDAIKDRKTVSELKTALFDALDDRGRDWQRIASTEMTSAIQQGIYAEIRDNHGPDQLVFKRPNPDACPHCRRVYLKPDGTPRVFRLSDLEESNIGKRAASWGPTIGPVHPWCQCQLVVLPEGYGFTRKRIVIAPFEDDDVKYKRGQIVSEETYRSLSSENKKKVGFDSVMEYTGESPAPETRKSFGQSDMGLVDQDECCRY